MISLRPQRLAECSGDDVHAAYDAAELRRSAPVLANETNSVRVVHHDHRIVLVGQVTYLVQLGEVAVHREDAIGCDKPVSRRCRLLQFRFQISHVAVAVAESLSFRKPDSIDDAGMVQFIGDDGVFGIEQCLKQAAVGIEAGTIEDSVFRAQKRTDPLFKLLVDGLRTADESNASEAVTPVVQRLLRGLDHRRMIGKAKIIVRAKIQNRRTVGNGNPCLLWPDDHALAFVQACALDLGDLVLEMMLNFAVHRAPLKSSD